MKLTPLPPAFKSGRVTGCQLLSYRWLAAIAVATVLSGPAGVIQAKPERVPPLTPSGLPNVRASHAVVIDMATGAEIFGKDADAVAGIASTTKIFVAMVVRKRGLELDKVTEITREDARYARGGARTHMELRHSFKNIDLLRAMLIASDNRAPTALARSVGLTPGGLVAAMNDLARELGLRKTRFTDPTGLRGNVSTPREMALALKATMSDPLLAEVMRTEEVSVRSFHSRPRHIRYRNTNQVLTGGDHVVYGGKTGYTRAAGYCLVVAAKVAGRDVIMVFLGARGKLTRFADFRRVERWMESKGALVFSPEDLPAIMGAAQ